MRIAVIALTQNGAVLADKISQTYPEAHVDIYQAPYNESLSQLVRKVFSEYQALIFIMALGIVVRVIGPLLNSKLKDPAVVCIDDTGKFVISVASGHWGGANQLTNNLAAALDALPVITTATDVHDKIAFDILAKEYGMAIEPLENLKKLNSAVVNGKPIALISQVPPVQFGYEAGSPRWSGIDLLPWENSTDLPNYSYLVVVTNKRSLPIQLQNSQSTVLCLRPRNIIAGIGCRRDISRDDISAALTQACEQAGISLTSIRKLVSIDLKYNEQGLLEAAAKFNLPLEFIPRGELASYLETHPEITQSEFVKYQIGVGSVCEPAALIAGRQADLILPKQIYKGVTIALCEEKSALLV